MRRMWLLVLLGACIDGPGRQNWDVDASFRDFVAVAEPVLAQGCGNPSCHGTAERPLEIYSVHQHRLDDRDVYLDAPLTQEEQWLNFVRSCGFAFDLDNPADCSLLRKPLDPEVGGSAHEGGIQYGDIENPAYQALLAWIDGEEPQ